METPEPEPEGEPETEPESYSEPGVSSPWVQQVYVAVVILWIVLIVCGNVWLVVGSVKARLHQSESLYIYVISIAVSSVIIACLVLPVHVLNFADLLNGFLCKLCEFNLVVSTVGNVGSQVAAAYFQWCQLARGQNQPFRYHLKCLSFIWVVAVVYSLRQLFLVDAITTDGGSTSCVLDLAISTSKYIYITDFVFIGLLPSALIIIFSVCTMLKAENVKGIILLGALISLFILLTFPARIFTLILQLELVDGSMLGVLDYTLTGLSFAYEWVSIALVLALDKPTRVACFKLLPTCCSLRFKKNRVSTTIVREEAKGKEEEAI